MQMKIMEEKENFIDIRIISFRGNVVLK